MLRGIPDGVAALRLMGSMLLVQPVDFVSSIAVSLDRLGGACMALCQADVKVDGMPAGLLHVFTHNPTYPWKEGSEAEVELPRALTDGKSSFVVEVRPRPTSDPVNIARIWVYEYSK